MGGGQEAEVIQEPTLTPQQLELLSGMISGLVGQIQGFPMGAPYGGAGVGSYDVRPFQYAPRQGMAAGLEPEPGLGGSGGTTITPESLKAPSREDGSMSKTIIDILAPILNPTAAPTKKEVIRTAPTTSPTREPTNVLPEVLATPTGNIPQDPTVEIIRQILTEPFVSPFREEMTGKYRETPGVYRGMPV